MSKKTYLSALLIKPKECKVCFESFIPRHMNPCTNPGCTFDMCQNCVIKSYHIPLDHKGKIQRRFVICTICNVLIDPMNPGISEFVRMLFLSHNFYENSILVGRNAAELLLIGLNVWKCESDECPGSHPDNIFLVEKIPCNLMGLLEEIQEQDMDLNLGKKRYCVKCVELKHEEETKGYLNEWNVLGFDTNHGLLGRICPGCGNKCQRVTETCARIQCLCGTHFCYCCGERFVSVEDVYDHLMSIYQTAFPTDDQIKIYLTKLKEIKVLKQGLPDDITDDEILIMLIHEKEAEENKYIIERIRMEKLIEQAKQQERREARIRKKTINKKIIYHLVRASSIKTAM